MISDARSFRADRVLTLHDMVLVKTEEGIGFGEIVALRDDLPEGFEPESVKPIYRPATAEDIEIGRENDELAKDARKYERVGEWAERIGWEKFFEKTGLPFTEKSIDDYRLAYNTWRTSTLFKYTTHTDSYTK